MTIKILERNLTIAIKGETSLFVDRYKVTIPSFKYGVFN